MISRRSNLNLNIFAGSRGVTVNRNVDDEVISAMQNPLNEYYSQVPVVQCSFIRRNTVRRSCGEYCIQ